jgi:hypothetical protein
MSKASRLFKYERKLLNQKYRISGTFRRKDMTLKAYRKQCRDFGAYTRGMKQHDKYMKGVNGND